MAESGSRFQWVLRLARFWCILALVIVGLAVAVTVAQGVLTVREGVELKPLLWQLLALLGEVVIGVFVVVIYGLIDTFVANERAVETVADRVRRLESVNEALLEATRRLADLEQMSDAAKGLLYRDRELEAMHERLHEYIIRQDDARAEAFLAEVQERLGYCEQVEHMRKELIAARETTIEQKVDSALERIGKIIEAKDWARAMRQARRLMDLLPTNPKVAALPQIIRNARTQHKRELLQQYGEAVRTSDIDRSIELIRELDKYLTPQEGAALRESARGVFRAKMANLGVQFSLRVTEEQWDEAIAIGQQIMQDYPNSRMAQEVREKMDALKSLAAAKRAQS